ncbi:MAG: hypothetical protein A2X56_00835 [Nitrospirae bacterium GWC2_57_13]|nr:MAG: hypothetical protein A2072_02810 [Nitrospirae bacterium GWC1_57_7]OGW28713.1 MAG: hypothetical protein A2X56_00835 [Nitrospirae bacterium GWC2_57_13]HAS53924.1 hypothetical protein [Nitrospiraceae bacterium]
MEIKLTVDDKPVTVKAGSTILDAAKAVGSKVPTLCQDDNLHPFGSCRICLVEVVGSPRKFTPSCTTPAMEGMVVRTMSPAIIDIRKTVLELLLINHPLDCPVCDKAGECRLQDLVHEYGLGKPRFDPVKKYLPADYESPIIERNISRCILCGKCVRICDEQNAVGEWAFTRRGTKARISTDFDRPLNCEFCGECVDICPVGALTTRQFRYRGRPWNLASARSVCNYCGCGCVIRYDTRDGRAVRVVAPNDNYLCSKGRFGWDAVHHADRIMTPKMRVGGKLVDCTWEEAVSVIATNLNVIRTKRGVDTIGGLGSVRTTNEDNYVFQKFLRAVVGTNNVDMLGRLRIPRGLDSAFFSGELAKIRSHRAILVLDADVGEINPRTGIEIVNAVNRRGGRLVLVNKGENKFNVLAEAVIVDSAEAALTGLIAALSPGGQGVREDIRRAAVVLLEEPSVAIIVPARVSAKEVSLIKQLAGLLQGVTFYPLVKRSNLQGGLDMGVISDYYPGYRKQGEDTTAAFAASWNAMLPDKPGMNALQMLEGIASKKTAALYIMGDDPVGSDRKLAPVLKDLEFLVVQDIFMSETAKLADVVLPAAGSAEKSGTFTNVERRLQELSQAEEPLAEAKSDWEIIQLIARKMGGAMNYASPKDVLAEIRSVVPQYRDLAPGACWPAELSPIAGTDADLSLASGTIMKDEVITSDRLLFSSGMTITRSQEISTIRRVKVATGK